MSYQELWKKANSHLQPIGEIVSEGFMLSKEHPEYETGIDQLSNPLYALCIYSRHFMLEKSFHLSESEKTNILKELQETAAAITKIKESGYPGFDAAGILLTLNRVGNEIGDDSPDVDFLSLYEFLGVHSKELSNCDSVYNLFITLSKIVPWQDTKNAWGELASVMNRLAQKRE